MKHLNTLILIALCTATTWVHAQTLDDVLASIATRNMQLRALAADHEATTLERRAENTIGGPSLEYSPFFDNGKTGLGSSELIVSQEFDFPTLYRQRRLQTDLERRVLDSQYAAARTEVLLEARLLCIDIIRTNQLIDMYGQRLADCDTILTLLQRRIDAGDATSLELNKARLTQKAVSQQLAATEADRTALLAQLQTLNGGEPIGFTERTFPECRMEPSFDDFAEAALAANADVAAAEATLTATGHSLAMSRRAWLPSLSVGYRRNTDGPARLNGFMLGAAFPLFSTSPKVKAARARQQAAQQELEATRHEAEETLRSRYNELLRIHAVLDHSDTALLQETLSLLSRALQYGQITALEYYTETADIYEKMQAHIDLHGRYARLYTEMHRDL